MGALSANSDEEHIEKMREFGLNVGMAFQIKDDLFDYGNEEIGKPLVEEDDARRRQAIKAKRECFEDCQEILLGIKNLEDRIKEGESLIEDKKDFKGSFAERYAKK